MTSVFDRIGGMSDEEAMCLLTNLQHAYIPPYHLVTNTTVYNIQGYDIVGSALINQDNEKAKTAYRKLGIEKIREIARTILMHPAFGASALCAMLDGHKVVIIVEKAAPRTARTAQPMLLDRHQLN